MRLHRPGTPSLDLGTIPKVQFTPASTSSSSSFSTSPSNLPIQTAPALLANPAASTTSFKAPAFRRSESDNPFADPPQTAESVDYFNCKEYFAPMKQPHHHPCKVSSPLARGVSGSPYTYTKQQQQPASYFSPAVTPAPQEALTRPSSPLLGNARFVEGGLPATPEEVDPFPYISYESSFQGTTSDQHHAPQSLHPPSPYDYKTLPPIPARQDVSSVTIDVKLCFPITNDLVKLRVDRGTSLAELKSKAAERMPGGWDTLAVAKEGIDTRDPANVPRKDLEHLGEESQWSNFLSAHNMGVGDVLHSAKPRIVVWAV